MISKGVFFVEKNKIRFITFTALIAAVYAAVTMAFSWMSYGQVQFRISEILVLLAFLDPRYLLGLVLGCFFANLTSPLGVIDVAVGTAATLIAVLLIIIVRKVFGPGRKSLMIASLCPVVSNAVLVGWELRYLFGTPFILNAAYVALGEFVVVTIMGTTVMNKIMKGSGIVEKLKIN
jgi:uncharacterized membrane protein